MSIPAKLPAPMTRAHATNVDPPAVVRVKVGSVTRSLAIGEIRLIAACENYTELALESLPRLLVRRTMQEWSALLPPQQFVRVHRGLLINLDQVGRLERVTS